MSETIERLSDERLRELRAMAEGANPGPWTTEKPSRDDDGWARGAVIAAVERGQCVYAPENRGGVFVEGNRCFIAAASPDVVDALAREVQEHRTMVERLRVEHPKCKCRKPWPCPTRAIIDGEKP